MLCASSVNPRRLLGSPKHTVAAPRRLCTRCRAASDAGNGKASTGSKKAKGAASAAADTTAAAATAAAAGLSSRPPRPPVMAAPEDFVVPAGQLIPVNRMTAPSEADVFHCTGCTKAECQVGPQPTPGSASPTLLLPRRGLRCFPLPSQRLGARCCAFPTAHCIPPLCWCLPPGSLGLRLR